MIKLTRNILFGAVAVGMAIGCEPIDEEPAADSGTITEANAETVAKSVLNTVDFARAFTSLGGSAQGTDLTRAAMGDTKEQTSNCAISGTVTTDITLVNNSLGFSVVTTNCNDGQLTTNGSMNLVFEQDQTSGVNSVTFDVDLTMTSAYDTASMDGTIVLTEDTSYNYTFTMDMAVNSQAAGGQVSVDTTQTFRGTYQTEPYEGSMIITGVDNGSIIVTASGTDVILEIDANGDGVYGSPITTPWSSFGE